MNSLKIAAIFSNHCVLQREKPICIFGECAENLLVEASLLNSRDEIISKNESFAFNGQWKIYLPSVSAQQDCKLKIVCENKRVEFSDISIGEVWLAGGQSNMEFELGNCTEGNVELSIKEDPNVRFYYTQKKSWKDEKFYESERNTSWQVWGSEWTKAWSAVGYLYAKKLAAELGVVVGVIGCNWGGTSASAWIDKSRLEKDEDLRTYLDEYEEAERGKTIEQQLKEYDDYEVKQAIWQKKCDAIYKENPQAEWNDVQNQIGQCPWPGPKCCKNPYRPNGLYECMLQRVIPYTLKGFIYYQGESDDHKPSSYYKLFSSLIDQWRTDWNDESLPFLFVQLPMHRFKQDKDLKNWCLIREAQLKVYKTIKNTGMVCASDLGQYNDIHPKSKKTVSLRLANISLTTVYKKNLLDSAVSPIPSSFIVIKNKLIISFDNAKDGFIYKPDNEELKNYKEMEERQGNKVMDDFTGFEVAGTDEIFYPATFEFGDNQNGMNTITLTCQNVNEIKYARYCWYNYGPVVVFSKNRLPLVPFRLSL